MAIAKGLIDLAANLGFGAVKFQKRTIDNFHTKNCSIAYPKVRGAPQGANKKWVSNLARNITRT